MTALTAQRKLDNLEGPKKIPLDLKAKATQVFYKGALVGPDSTGYGVPVASTAGIRAWGVVDTGSQPKIDTTGESNGDTVLKVESGCFPFKIGGGADALAQADVGNEVYLIDDQTVGKTDGNVPRGKAGILLAIEGTLAYVWVGPQFVASQVEQYLRSAPESVVAPGALSVAVKTTLLGIDGTDAFTLAAGVFKGQQKYIRAKTAVNTPLGTVTPAAVAGYTSILFDAVGEWAILEWSGTAWEIVATNATVNP